MKVNTEDTHSLDLKTIENGIYSSEQKEKGRRANFEEAITACGYGKFQYLLFLSLIPTCCAQVFSSSSVAYVIPTAECDLKLTNHHKGALNAAAYIGLTVGALFGGFASDVFGRRRLIVLGFIAEATSNFLSSWSPSFWFLLFMRIISGFSITGPVASVVSFCAETHNSNYRSRIIMMNGGLSAVAQTIHPALAYFIIPLDFRIELIPGILDFTSWRLFLLVSSLPGFLASFIFYFFPESPKFLMMKGRTGEALESFRRIYAINTGKPANSYPIDDLEVPATPKEASEQDTDANGIVKVFANGWKQISPIFRPPYLNKALVVFAICGCTMMAMNSVRGWVPQLFATLNEATLLNATSGTTICSLIGSVVEVAPSNSVFLEEGRVCLPVSGEVYLRSLVIGAAAAFSFLISTPMIKWIGRKNFAKVCFPAATALAISINWATNSDIFMTLLAVYTAVVRNAFTTISTITVDLFPTAFRSLAVSMTLMCGRIASVVGNLLFPVLLDIGCSVVFFSIAGILSVASVLLWFVSSKTVNH